MGIEKQEYSTQQGLAAKVRDLENDVLILTAAVKALSAKLDAAKDLSDSDHLQTVENAGV